ncbi:MAG: RsmG family class I SAM-dependent methyltransferase [Acidimicrobiia bacterium]
MTNANLVRVLERSKAEGFLGPGPLDSHIDHGRALAAIISEYPGRFCDLGSGGGIPGLILLDSWPTSSAVLLDGAQRRCAFLEWAVEELAWTDRATVVSQRAEEAGHSELRNSFDLVVARSFAGPAVTSECAAPLLTLGGRLVVSEPPEWDPQRWPEAGLAGLGLVPEGRHRAGSTSAVVIRKDSVTDVRYPRRVGIPEKRPLW